MPHEMRPIASAHTRQRAEGQGTYEVNSPLAPRFKTSLPVSGTLGLSSGMLNMSCARASVHRTAEDILDMRCGRGNRGGGWERKQRERAGGRSNTGQGGDGGAKWGCGRISCITSSTWRE